MNLATVEVVGLRGPMYLGHSIWQAEPITLLSLECRKEVFYVLSDMTISELVRTMSWTVKAWLHWTLVFYFYVMLMQDEHIMGNKNVHFTYFTISPGLFETA